MNDRSLKRFSVGGALAFAAMTTVLYALQERRFSWAGVTGGGAWLAATLLVRRLLIARGLVRQSSHGGWR